jgi:hypothetical protein
MGNKIGLRTRFVFHDGYIVGACWDETAGKPVRPMLCTSLDEDKSRERASSCRAILPMRRRGVASSHHVLGLLVRSDKDGSRWTSSASRVSVVAIHSDPYGRHGEGKDRIARLSQAGSHDQEQGAVRARAAAGLTAGAISWHQGTP